MLFIKRKSTVGRDGGQSVYRMGRKVLQLCSRKRTWSADIFVVNGPPDKSVKNLAVVLTSSRVARPEIALDIPQQDGIHEAASLVEGQGGSVEGQDGAIDRSSTACE